MKLNQLKSTTVKSKKRVGRGYGSGKGGHTATRGAKGQKARSKLPLYFEGTSMRKSLIRRLPMLRGKLRFKSFNKKPLIVNLKRLQILPKNTKVTLDILIKHHILPKEAKNCQIKILGDGNVNIPLIVTVPISQSAAKKIVKAGGKIVIDQPKPKAKPKIIKKKKLIKKKSAKK